MRYGPIAYTMPQYEDYPNYWMKAYEQGTTTALSMATDATGDTTAAKFEINTNGFPVTSGAALVIPYISEAYDLWLFPTEALADANDTTNAIQIADNMIAAGSVKSLREYATLSSAISDISSLMVGDVLILKERTTGNGGGGTWDVVDATTVTVNTYNIVAGDATRSLVLRLENKISINAYGAVAGDSTDNTGAINAAAEAYRVKANTNFIGNAGTTNPHHEHGAELISEEAGVYRCTGTLWFGADRAGGENYADSVKNITFATGTVISSHATGLPAVDCTGSYGARWNNVTIFGDATNTPNIGLLLARSGASAVNPSSANHKFINCKVIGNYSISSVYNYGSEVNTWIAPEIRNSKAGSYAAFYITSDNIARKVTSAFTTVATTDDANAYQSTYAPTILGGDLRFDVDGTGDNAMMVLESPSYGPKIDGVYCDMLQGGATDTPYFKFDEATGTSTSSSEKRIQSPSITNCQFEAEFDSVIEVNADVRELTFTGNSLAGSGATTADIVINDGFALHNSTIQPYRGGSTVLPMVYDTNSTGIIDEPVLNFIPIYTSGGYDYTESTLTLDDVWNELDLSSHIPANTRNVLLKVFVNNSGTIANVDVFKIREPDNTSTASEAVISPAVTNILHFEEVIVPCVAGKVQYKASSNYNDVGILVRGWYC